MRTEAQLAAALDTKARLHTRQIPSDDGSVDSAQQHDPLVQQKAHHRVRCDLTVIVPAYNERESLADTLQSLKAQTVQPVEIIVVDDCSTDGTGDLARTLGVTVLCPSTNTGSKAGAQNYALATVRTTYTMAIDADTMLAMDAIERLQPAFENPQIAAACGFVLPRFVQTLWERGRYIEYLLAFTWYKPIQEFYDKPMISSGCFSMYRTEILQQLGGWQTRTLAEDMDLTWSCYEQGHGVRFIPEAVSFPIEPHTFHFMHKQLKRWSHGFMQNVRLHGRNLLEIPFLCSFVAVALWDAIFASLAFLMIIPMLVIFFHMPLLLLAYIIDVPMVLVPVVWKAGERREVLRALASVPSFLVLRLVNSLFVLEAFFSEFILRRSFRQYEKGH
jgi:biofilm PGA synthesis N-glycosyltransferase PgaC